jgi:organic hydroperoxide reductase OsmC/OhrA
MKALYTAAVTPHVGREGHMKSYDGRFEVHLRLPTEMEVPGGEGTDASYGRMTLSMLGANYLPLVELEAHVVGLSPKEALFLRHAAHEVCSCSNATHGNMDVRLSAR